MSPETTDVLICGSGSAGICAALWLAKLGIPFRVLEARSGPLETGQADGVQCRTVEIFESFGIADPLLRESYHVLELAFWSQQTNGQLVRTGRAPDTPAGLSHQPHVVLNQARLNAILLEEVARQKPNYHVHYGHRVASIRIDDTVPAYPVEAVATYNGAPKIFRAKYALGCDGAHSMVRRQLGYSMIGDTTDAVWGVMDIYPRTDFPDIRRKTTIHSDAGALLIIPREGGFMVRFYMQMPSGTVAKQVTLQTLHNLARRILKGYTLDIAHTAWWSAYAIGQRLASELSAGGRVFLAGDACHTHSPKAGQGMNISLQDGYNIGWKLAYVLKGKASSKLLDTYVLERHKVAADLITFDRELTNLYSARAQAPSTDRSTGDDHDARFTDLFLRNAEYMAGLTSRYEDSSVTSSATSDQAMAPGISVGMRFPSAQVVRYYDARAVQLVTALPSDGRWRVVVFAGDGTSQAAVQRLGKFTQMLVGKTNPVGRLLANQDSKGYLDLLLVFSGSRTAIKEISIPDIFQPPSGPWHIKDLHKVFVDDNSYNSGHGRAYDKYGIDSASGAVIVVRPDQYVSLVTSLEKPDPVVTFFQQLSCTPTCL